MFDWQEVPKRPQPPRPDYDTGSIFGGDNPPMLDTDLGVFETQYVSRNTPQYKRRHVRYAWIIPVVIYFLLAVGLGLLVGYLTVPEVGILVFVGVSVIFLVSLAGMRFIGQRHW